VSINLFSHFQIYRTKSANHQVNTITRCHTIFTTPHLGAMIIRYHPHPQLLLPLLTFLASLQLTTQEALVNNPHNVYGGGCPQACNGHGRCVGSRIDNLAHEEGHECMCHSGFTGVACNLRVCPAGPTWADPATAVSTAHKAGVECSGFGYCNRQTGACLCRSGFEGAACNKLSCPKGPNNMGIDEICHGHGRCMTMAEAAITQDFVTLFEEIEYTNWDKDMIQGCVCGEGWTGYDCNQRMCPWGPDPRDVSAKDEIQVLDCQCPGTCSGECASVRVCECVSV